MASHSRKRVRESHKKHSKWCGKVIQRRKLWRALRQAQRKSGCTTTTIKAVAKAVAPLLENAMESSSDEEPAPSQHKFDSEIMAAAEAEKLELHGCVDCNDYVFVPKSVRMRCPKCRHPRFNAVGKPNEV